MSCKKVETCMQDLNFSYHTLNFTTFQLKILYSLIQWAISSFLSLEGLDKKYCKVALRKKREAEIALKKKCQEPNDCLKNESNDVIRSLFFTVFWSVRALVTHLSVGHIFTWNLPVPD